MAPRKTSKPKSSGDKAGFSKSFAASTKGAWKKARETEGRKGLTAPPGTYIGRCHRVRYGVDKNKQCYMAFDCYIVSDNEKYHRQPFNKFYSLAEPKKLTPEQKAKGWKQKTAQDQLEKLAEEFQRFGYETADTEPQDLMEFADEISQDKPYIKVSIRANDEGGENWVNIQGVLDEDDPRYPSDEDDEDDDTEEDDEDEDDDDSEEEDEDDEEEPPKTAGRGRTKKAAPADEDDDDEPDDDEEEEEEPPKTRGRAKAPIKKKVAKKAEPEDDDDEDDIEDDEPPEDYDDDDEPEDDPPAKKKVVKKAAPKTRRK